MVELDVGDVLTLVQTFAIIAALLLTVYFSRRQIQAFTTDLESRVLNDIDEKFHRIGEIFIERPELVQTIYQTSEAVRADVPFTYYVLFFCSHIYHMRERGLLQDNEWTGWLRWMRRSFHQGTLGRYWREGGMAGWVDPAFARFVQLEILARPLSPEEAGPVAAGSSPAAG